ncbi:hypothetical protein [Amnibacterium kyonggiense]
MIADGVGLLDGQDVAVDDEARGDAEALRDPHRVEGEHRLAAQADRAAARSDERHAVGLPWRSSSQTSGFGASSRNSQSGSWPTAAGTAAR